MSMRKQYWVLFEIWRNNEFLIWMLVILKTNSAFPLSKCTSFYIPVTKDWHYFFKYMYQHCFRLIFTSFFIISSTEKKKSAIKSLTRFLDAAVVGGFVLLNEANSVKGDPGKKRSKLIKTSNGNQNCKWLKLNIHVYVCNR